MREISAYDRMVWPVPLLEDFLREGKHARDLAGYFGLDEYRRLRKLMASIPSRPSGEVRAGAAHTSSARVYLLPGMLGSQLGTLRANQLPPDLLWIDPADVVAGFLSDLRLPEGSAIHSLGVIAYSYLSLKLELNRAGFDVRLWDYDWRQDIAMLGGKLAADIAADPARDIRIVGHSMGGLVARAAMRVADANTPGRVSQFIALGTPHRGSFSALQALRGSYSVVRRLAALDRFYNAEQLTARVFCSFPSLYQMLPDAALEGALDLSDAAEWPRSGPRPNAGLLELRAAFAATLAPLDARTTCIAGIHQPTVVKAAELSDEFRYTVTLSGDGTVPLASSALTSPCYYVTCEHGDLPRDAGVAQCCADLLLHGSSAALPTTLVDAATAPDALATLEIGDSELAAAYPEHIDWQSLTAEQRGSYFNQLNLAPAQYRRLR